MRNKLGYKGLLILIWLMISSLSISSCHKKEENTDMTPSASGVDDKSAYEGSSPKERDLVIEGIARFQSGDYQGADSCFVAALNYNPKSLVAMLNGGLANIGKASKIQEKGDSLYTPEDSIAFSNFMKNATDSFQKAAEPRVNKGNVSSLAFYNAGNIFFNEEQYENAIQLYKESLRLNPEDDHARRNLRIAQLKKNEQQNNQDQDQQNQQDQKNQQDQQDQKQEDNQNQPKPEQINEQTSEQILDAAERKENQKRLQMKINEQKSSENSGSSIKGW